jgi:NAD(P)-dependent dehydrogenase (short-subunit alcohol dehydrogenase family)
MSKSIVITGGSRGIGAATARLCGARGWSVAIGYRGDEPAARKTVADVESAGGRAIALMGDAAKESDVIALFEAATTAFGIPDGVVVNAGTIGSNQSRLADMTVERMERVIAVNLTGALITAREAIRRMAKPRGGNGGAIVFTSSAAARLGAGGEYVDYAASKGGIDTLTIGLSREVGSEGIRVNAVRPGLILTDIHAAGGQPGRAERLGVNVPIGRAGTPDETAEAIVWLLSDAASYVNGAILDVTGGR